MLTAYAATTAEQVTGDTGTELSGLINLLIAKIPAWIAGFVVVIFCMLLAKMARSIVENKMAERGIEEEHKEVQILGGRMAYTTIVVIGVTIGLKIAGIDLTTILAAVAFGVGFALKDLIMNFLAGVMILLGRHFTIGDFINVGGTVGRVKEIQSRVTILQAIDGTKVIVPNAEILRKQVISFTSNPFRRIEVIIGVDYRTNLENAVKICMDSIKSTKGVLLEPKPVVLVDEFSDSSINLKLRAWVESKGAWLLIRSSLILNVRKAFDKYGIVIPWPIRTVAYDKDSVFNEKLFEGENSSAQDIHEEENSEMLPEINTPGSAPTPVLVTETVASDDRPLEPLNEQRVV